MLDALDGPSSQITLSVGIVTVVEARVGSSALDDRKVLTIQPIDGSVYVYFGSSTPPSAADVTAHGFDQPKKSFRSYEAGPQQKIYILSQAGTINVKIAERA